MNNHSANLKDHSQMKIKVMGIGGGGCNTINRLSALGLNGVELIAVNTDAHSLFKCNAHDKILLGKNITFGHGAGGIPQIGGKAAEESYQAIIEAIQGAHLLFLTAGLGGGTGSGAIEIAARIAASLDILTVSTVTLPFAFEAERRKSIAYEATIKLQPFTNTLITIPNDRLVELSAGGTPIETALGLSDNILIRGIQGISEILNNRGLMNIDFSHISKFMGSNGGAFISVGFGSGSGRVIDAIQDALTHPLLEPIPIHQARGIVIKLSGDVIVEEIDTAVRFLKENAPNGVEILPVLEQKEIAGNQLMISLMLTGMGATPISYPQPAEKNSIEEPVSEQHKNTESHNLVYADMRQEYEDELEVPAFIRKGYNLKKQYE